MNRIQNWIIYMVCLFLGIVFVSSGIGKIIAFHQFVSTVTTLIPLGLSLARFCSIVLIIFEIILGILFFIKSFQKYASLLSTGLIFFFLLLGIYAGVCGYDMNCNCFGFGDMKLAGKEHFLQNIFLFILSIYVFVNRFKKRSVSI